MNLGFFSRRFRSQVLAGIITAASVAGVVGTQALADGPTTWWVATTGTAADPASTGTSCADPSYVGDDDETIQTAIDGASAGDTIRLCDGVWTLAAPLDVSKDLDITGNSPADSVLDGNDEVRILVVASGVEVSIYNLLLRNGLANTEDDQGGAVKVKSTGILYVEASVFLNNLSLIHI